MAEESISDIRYVNEIATPIWNYLSQPENAQIKCIVLCYGVPSLINVPGDYTYSVDSALTLLGNPDVLSVRHWGIGLNNPYWGKNIDFDAFRNSDQNTLIGPGNRKWKLNYLVCRLDGFSEPTENVTVNGSTVAIPRDVKALIDRSVRADSGGKYVIDRSNANSIKSQMVSAGMDANDIIADQTNVFLTGQEDTTGYFGEHANNDGNADTYTTWTRPYNSWHDGGVAVANTNDGQSFRVPKYVWGILNGPPDYQGSVDAGKLKVVNMRASDPARTSTDQYSTHQVVLRDAGGQVLMRATFNWGTCQLDLSNVAWPAGHQTFIEMRFPLDDPQHPDEYIPDSRTPYTADTSIWAARETGITFSCASPQNRLARTLSSAYVAEGASGTMAIVMEGGLCVSPEYTFPRYSAGYSWAEAAYMGTDNLAWQGTVIGDPLMAPSAIQPTVDLVSPSPSNGNHIRGSVSLRATAVPNGNGTIQRVEFWVSSGQTGSKIGTDYQAPYECVWDSEASSGGNRTYSDGTYAIEAVGYQSGNAVGTSTVSRSIVLDSAGVPGISISEPQTEDSIVSELAPVVAQPGGAPSSVQFWLFGNGNPILAGTAWTSPYECAISSTVATNGVYQLQAIAYYGTPDSASYSALRRIVLVSEMTAFTEVGVLGNLDEETELMLVGVPVVAGTSATMGGALYVEDSNRVAGIRVTTQSSVATGRKVVVRGVLHKYEAGVTERYIEAYQIWDMGECVAPTPLAMPNKSLGGAAPAGTLGVTGGVGLYNLGLLVRTFGTVTYVGEDFVYVDDGSGLRDGNSRLGPYKVSLEGGAIPDPVPYSPPVGVLVNCNSLEKPGIGDYVVVTGISSTKQVEENVVRYLRPRGQSDIAYARNYQRCAMAMPGLTFSCYAFVRPDATFLQVGDKLRVVDALVWEPWTGYFTVYHSDAPNWLPFVFPVEATTALQMDQVVTITGTYMGDECTPYLEADGIYLGGSEYGALSVHPRTSSWASASSVERGGGPFKPWPGPTAEEILASDGFRDRDNRPNCIGWALAQPDGTRIDLKSEIICNEWYDGRSLGLRETYEPSAVTPRLVLCLPESVARIAVWNQIDIVGGTVATLSNGQRAILYPQAVYLRTDRKGTPTLMMPKTFDSDGEPEDWPWRRLVHSR